MGFYSFNFDLLLFPFYSIKQRGQSTQECWGMFFLRKDNKQITKQLTSFHDYIRIDNLN